MLSICLPGYIQTPLILGGSLKPLRLVRYAGMLRFIALILNTKMPKFFPTKLNAYYSLLFLLVMVPFSIGTFASTKGTFSEGKDSESWIFLQPGVGQKVSLYDIESLADPERRYTPDNLSAEQFGKESKITPSPNLRYNPERIWLRLPLRNNSATTGKWIFRLTANIYADIYYKHEGEIELLARLSDQEFTQGYQELELGLTGVFDLAAGEETELYILLAPYQWRANYIEILSEESVNSINTKEILLLAIIFSVVLTLCLVNFAQFLVLRRAAHLYYVLQQLCITGVGLGLSGIGLRTLWSMYPNLDSTITIVFLFLTHAAIVQFMRAFFNTRINAPRIDVFYKLVIAFPAVMAAIALIDYRHVAFLYMYTAVLSLATVCVSAGWFWFRGIPFAKYYIAGWGIIFLAVSAGLVVELVGYTGIQSIDLLNTAVMLEAIIMFFALTQQVNGIRVVHDRQQQEMLGLYRDRNDEANKLLHAEKERLSLLNKYKHQLEHIASVSHDMSQPVQSLKMTIEALTLTDNKNPYTQTLSTSVDYLDNLMAEVISDAKTEYHAQQALIPLNEIFRESVEQHRRKAAAKGIQLHYLDSLQTIDVSRVVLQRIINNLVNNAVSHTHSGKVLVGLRRRQQALCIQVIDTGEGMSEAKIQDLLKPFISENTDQRHYGLGLSIVKTLCDESGFSFDIKSQPGKGCCFSILIPNGR